MVLWIMVVVIGLTTDTDASVFYGPNQQYTGFNIHPNITYNLAESGVPVPKSNRQRIVLKYCHRSFFILSAKHNVNQGSIEVSISPSLISIRACLHPDTYDQCSKNGTVQKKGTFFDCAKMAPFWLTWNNTGHVTLGSGNVFGTNVLLEHHGNVDFKVYYIFYGIDGDVDGTYCFIFDLPPLLAGSLTLQVTEDAEPGTVLHTFTHLRPKKVYGDQFFKQGVDSLVVNITQTQLLLQRRLDYDSGKTSYAFYMICKNESAGVNLTVIIDVIDVQDYKPIIYKRQGIALIEELPLGSPVGPWFLANDRDKGDELIYSLSGPDAGLFNIDESTGQMTTKGRIDREKTSLLTVSLKIKDKAGHEATTEMKVNILNVNDNQPLFKSHFRRIHLPMSHRGW
ncbi:protocadherin-12-like [Haliotis asinina]|uniref:protocadherin-12-like n=1 Tax=Haliotis asinina TaxID=109174 RepID=UPI00353191E8